MDQFRNFSYPRTSLTLRGNEQISTKSDAASRNLMEIPNLPSMSSELTITLSGTIMKLTNTHRIGVRPSRAMPFNRPKTCDPIQSTLLAVFSRRTSESRLSETGSSFEESCGTSPWHVIVCSLNCGRTIAGRTWAAHLDGGCFRSGSRQMRVQY